MGVNVDQDLVNTKPPTLFQPDLEDWFVTDR
jgi:hypothetical protein